MIRRSLPAALAACAILAAAPALAYVLPPHVILRDAAKKRAAAPASVEARGKLLLTGQEPVPATLWVKSPGRCRLELATPGATAGQRPFAIVRNGKLAVTRGLDAQQAALALAEAACTLLAAPPGGAGDRAFAAALAQRGVAPNQVALGHFEGRVAYVFGGRMRDPRPQAWLDKATLQPVRLVADLQGTRRDVGLSGWPAPPAPGAPATTPATTEFPRRMTVRAGEEVEAAFEVERVTPNPRVPDTMF